jgi:hypothetical protein
MKILKWLFEKRKSRFEMYGLAILSILIWSTNIGWWAVLIAVPFGIINGFFEEIIN